MTDIYALKYIEFYDTRRREQCEAMLKQNGLWKRGEKITNKGLRRKKHCDTIKYCR